VKIDLPFSKMHTMGTLKNTLISTTQMTDMGFTVNFGSKLCKIMGPLPECQLLAMIP
jgi:hypothetical protein